jgi:phosphatidylglycerophosphate synthase
MGAFVDAVIDRYSDFFVFGGILIYFANKGDLLYTLVLFAIISGSFLVSYIRARAELVIEKCNVGLMERAERIVILAAGSFFNFLNLALWILAIGTHLTALHRIWHTIKNQKQA